MMACDLTPELWRRAGAGAAAGLTLDGGRPTPTLPFADGEFDIVMSYLGIMFGPHGRASCSKLSPGLPPAGTIGLLSSTLEGFIGRMFAAMEPCAPPPPPGARRAPLSGSEQHVRSLLGDPVTGISAQRGTVR